MPLDPTTAAWLDAGSRVLGAAAARPPMSSRAEASVFSPFDSSGFNVTIRGAALPIGSGSNASLSVLMLAVIGGLFFLWKRSH